VGDREENATPFGSVADSYDRVAALDVVRSPAEPRTHDEAMERRSRQHTVTVPAGAPFGAPQIAEFGFVRVLPLPGVPGVALESVGG